MDKKFLKYIGHDLYNVKKLKERKRYIVFRIRCGLHKSQIGALLDFFKRLLCVERCSNIQLPLWNKLPVRFFIRFYLG